MTSEVINQPKTLNLGTIGFLSWKATHLFSRFCCEALAQLGLNVRSVGHPPRAAEGDKTAIASEVEYI